MKKILMVFGTRPEAIKMAPLVKAFQNQPHYFQTIVCVTGQHREMLDQVLQLFEIVPDYDLAIMKPGQDLFDVTSKVLLGMKEVLQKAQPDLVLVHGDTTTSTATALAAFYLQIQVGHIEAGLRTHNIYSPWPEEINRQLTGRIANWHFAPTQLSVKNLIAEGISKSTIIETGNTVIDALHIVSHQLNTNPTIEQEVLVTLVQKGLETSLINKWNAGKRRLVLITGHRRENFGEGFLNICHAIKDLAEKFPEVDFVYPVHLNPNVLQPVNEILKTSNEKVLPNNNILLIAPLDYLPFVYLMSKSYLVLTDSGGIQEEAPGLGKPVLVMRDTSERPEAIEAGTVKLVGTDQLKIYNEVSLLLEDKTHYNSMARANNPYGDGKACERIIDFLMKEFK